MTPMPDGKTLLGVFPCINESSTNLTNYYNTMVQMYVTDPWTVAPGGVPPFKRLGNGRLFYGNEVYVGIGLIKSAISDDSRPFLG